MTSTERATPTLDLKDLEQPELPAMNAAPETPASSPAMELPEQKTESREPPPPPLGGISIPIGLLTIATIINLAVGCLNYWNWFSLSYDDIRDAPIFYYTEESALAEIASKKGDPTKFIQKMIADVQSNHGIVLDRKAVLIASPEFKLIPSPIEASPENK